MNLTRSLLAFAALTQFHAAVIAQTVKKALPPPVKTAATAKPLPVDPALRTGKLANGFTYYIRKNTEPKNRATFYLVVNAGSILEQENQRGLAHFMEHMSFNGTKHYPKNELIDYLQRSGIRFGADLNAFTSFDETVYQLPLPTDSADILQHGFQIMRDWAQDATLDPTEIDRERGVIMEEKRLRMGVQQRVQDKTLPGLVNYSRYADRLPIGTDEVLKNFTTPTITSFYKDWYRPDLECLIVVGDIDVNATEAQIKKMFSDLKMPAVVKKRVTYPIVLDGKNKFTEVTDAEVPETSVGITIKFKEHANKTVADLRGSLIANLFSGMFSARLAEAGKNPSAPFVQLSGGLSGLMGGLNALSISLVPRKGELETGFKAAWAEAYRVRQNGFTTEEFNRSKQSMLSGLEASMKEKDKQSSTSLADQYKDLFLKGEAVPGMDNEYKLIQELLPAITLTEVNAVAKVFLKNTDRDIIITAPLSEKATLPAQQVVDGWIKTVEQSPVKAYTEAAIGSGLIPTLPSRGTVVAEKQILEIGVTEWTLSNGAKVVLKPTDFKNNEISFLALSPGGSSLYPDADFESAANAAGIIGSFGLGAYDNITLPKLLNGKQVSVQPFISERMEGLQGGASIKDLGTAMELVYLYYTAPRKDTALFKRILQNSAQQISSRYSDPNAIFGDTMAAVLGEYNIRRTGPTLDKLNSISLDKVERIYKERFANAGDFTFFFVGSFNKDSLKGYVEQYIASLPGVASKEQAKDLGIHIPTGKISKTVMAGKEDKATVSMIFSGDYVYNSKNNLALSALQEILQYRLLERLRETEGGVYTPSARVSKNKYPLARYAFAVNFGCSPANVETLIAATLDEIKKLKENGISATDLQKFKAEQVRQIELMEKNNGFWMNYISSQYTDQEDLLAFTRMNTLLDQLDATSLQQAAKEYFNENNYIRFVLLPEGK